jgi:hypothetical protein
MSGGGAEGGNSQETMRSENVSMNPSGAILVWDLDKTLVANYFNPANPAEIEDPIINTNALKIMNTAFKSPNFSANMMLTNNGNPQFIQLVIFLMTNEYNKMFPEEQVQLLFSCVYTAARNPDGSYKDPRVLDTSVPESQRDPRYVAKRVEDVRNMCQEAEIPADNLARRIFFFDDNTEHQMVTAGISRGGISMRNYIQIEPPFDTVAGDRTDYGAVLAFLQGSNAARGGGAQPSAAGGGGAARNLANLVNMRKQSGGRKSRRKSSNVFRKWRRRRTARRQRN